MLIDIPNQALVNRIIPKNRFNFKDATKIDRIKWIGKLSTSTINLASDNIIEIEIFSIDMLNFDKIVISGILDKIPQEILFIVNDEFAVMQYNKNLIVSEKNINLKIKGLSIDEVRDNFLRQILGIDDLSKPLYKQIELLDEIKLIRNRINNINKKIKKELQVNKKQSLARKRYSLEQQLNKIRREKE